MRKDLKAMLATAAVLAALTVGFDISAYADTPSSKGQDGMMQGSQGGMMQGGQDGMMGMMNMMVQMNAMMETCNKMMQGMAQHQDEKAPKEGGAPEKEG